MSAEHARAGRGGRERRAARSRRRPSRRAQRGGHRRGCSVTPGDVETEPSLERTTATKRDALAVPEAARVDEDARTGAVVGADAASRSPPRSRRTANVTVERVERRRRRRTRRSELGRRVGLDASVAARGAALREVASARTKSSAESGGTVSVTRPFAALVDGGRAGPRSGCHEVELGVAVWHGHPRGASDGVERRDVLAARGAVDAAHDEQRPRARRGRTIAPVESAGCASRSAPSARRCSATGWPTTSNDEPVPIGGEPTRAPPSATRRPSSGTCPAARPCRRRARSSRPRRRSRRPARRGGGRGGCSRGASRAQELRALAADLLLDHRARRGRCRGCRGRSPAWARSPFGRRK